MFAIVWLLVGVYACGCVWVRGYMLALHLFAGIGFVTCCFFVFFHSFAIPVLSLCAPLHFTHPSLHPCVHPFAQPTPPPLPAVVYEPGGPLLMGFEHHPELISMPAMGAINKLPSVWQPEWVPATLLVYGGAQRAPLINGQPSQAVFGVLWQDNGRVDNSRLCVEVHMWRYNMCRSLR